MEKTADATSSRHIQASTAGCAATCRRASSRMCSPCSECVKGEVSGQNGAGNVMLSNSPSVPVSQWVHVSLRRQ
eukprot:scaffold9618_cov123-Isochrysis_galbana.AAC.11